MNQILELRLKEIGTSKAELIKIISPPAGALVILYTSHFEGLGSKKSDFDIYIITNDYKQNNELISRRGKYWTVEKKYINEIEVDIETWDMKNVKKIIHEIDSKESSYLGNDMMTFINRLKTGVILQNDNEGEFIKKLINESQLKKKLINESILASNSWLTDAITMYEIEEIECSLYCLNTALDFAVQAYHVSKGIFTLKKKWLLKILKNTDIEVYNEYKKYKFYGDKNFSNQVSFIQNLTSEVLINC